MWAVVKKALGSSWRYILLALAVAIPALGWYLERRRRRQAEDDRDRERQRADTATEVAKAEAGDRERAEAARDQWRTRYEDLGKRHDAERAETDAAADRIDENAGDVKAVADDINRELGLRQPNPWDHNG